MRGRALIVDKDPAVCDLVRSLLTSAGMEVMGLTSSSDAAIKLREEKFAVVLLIFVCRRLTDSNLRDKRERRALIK